MHPPQFSKLTRAIFAALNQEYEMSNVTPIRPDIPDHPDFSRVQGVEYAGPSDAVKAILDENNFNEAAMNRGWIELRIVAQFTNEGAMFHTVQAASVVPVSAMRENTELPDDSGSPVAVVGGENEPVISSAPPSPALRALALLGIDNGMGAAHFIRLASLAQMNKLDEQLQEATEEDIELLVSGEVNEQEAVVVKLGCQESHDILKKLFEEG